MKALFLVLALFVLGCAGRAPLPPKAIALNQDGVAALARGDLMVAEARLALAVEYNPRFTEAWVNLGLVELRRGNLVTAREDFLRARSLNPDLPTPHHALGVLADRRGLPAEAEKHYRAALKVDPGFAPARANLGRLLFTRGALDLAREQFLRLTQVAPDRVEGWAGLVEIFMQLGRDDDAGEALDVARARFGDVPPLVLLVGRDLLRRAKFEEAESTLAALTRDPDPHLQAAAWAWTAVARIGRNDDPAAILAAKEALALDAEDDVAAYAMGMALKGEGDEEDASPWLQKAARLRPTGGGRTPWPRGGT